MPNFKIFNIISFYIYWWVSIWAASEEKYFIGPLLAVISFIIHFVVIEEKMKELYLLLVCFIIGILLENSFINFGIIEYKGILFEFYGISPLWVLLLWIGFGLTLFHSSIFILGKFKLSFLLGFIFGPIIYFSAHKFGSLTLKLSYLHSYLILGISMGLIVLLINIIAVKVYD
tara:strand:- start:86 stop:604 length:519 start_codon:yes stop_codon:yes gene_type:complete